MKRIRSASSTAMHIWGTPASIRRASPSSSTGVRRGISLVGFFSADYNYGDDTNASLQGDPLYALDSYGLLGARIGVKSEAGRWSAMLWGRNLTDDFKATGILSNGDVLSRWNTEGRTYGVTFQYDF